MEELKACPFCGSDQVEFMPDEEQQLEDTTTGFIWCHGCDFSSDSFYSQKIAAEKWNRRSAPENKALTCDGCIGKEKRPRNRTYWGCQACTRNPNIKDEYEARRPEATK